MDAEDFELHRLDHAFHDELVGALGFSRGERSWRACTPGWSACGASCCPCRAGWTGTLAEHKAILAAIEARDEEAARHAMRERIARVLGEFEMLSRDRPDLFAP